MKQCIRKQPATDRSFLPLLLASVSLLQRCSHFLWRSWKAPETGFPHCNTLLQGPGMHYCIEQLQRARAKERQVVKPTVCTETWAELNQQKSLGSRVRSGYRKLTEQRSLVPQQETTEAQKRCTFPVQQTSVSWGREKHVTATLHVRLPSHRVAYSALQLFEHKLLIHLMISHSE